MHRCERLIARDALRGAIEIGLRATGGKMQHAVDRTLRQGGRDLRRKTRGLDGAIGHHGAHGQAGLREITLGEIAGAVLAGEIEQRRAVRIGLRAQEIGAQQSDRSPLSPSAECTARKPTARAASAVRRPTVNAGIAVSCARRG